MPKYFLCDCRQTFSKLCATIPSQLAEASLQPWGGSGNWCGSLTVTMTVMNLANLALARVNLALARANQTVMAKVPNKIGQDILEREIEAKEHWGDVNNWIETMIEITGPQQGLLGAAPVVRGAAALFKTMVMVGCQWSFLGYRSKSISKIVGSILNQSSLTFGHVHHSIYTTMMRLKISLFLIQPIQRQSGWSISVLLSWWTPLLSSRTWAWGGRWKGFRSLYVHKPWPSLQVHFPFPWGWCKNSWGWSHCGQRDPDSSEQGRM